MLREVLAGNAVFDAVNTYAADVNGDGKTDLFDLADLKVLAGIGLILTVQKKQQP